MASIKFYALCSENMYALKRHQKTIPKTDLMIILNSMNSQFIKEASSYCKKEGIDFKVTKSDRTPATGKNSVLDEFKSSEHDFMVLIDGDDFLTPHGVFTYKQIADMKSPPDVLALECQYGINLI
jgi:hypothetical protein